MGQAEEDVLKALGLCSQPDDTGAAFGKGTDQRGQCFIPQRGKLQRVRLVGQPSGRHPLLLQHGKGLGDCQHPQQRAAPAVLLQLLQRTLEQHILQRAYRAELSAAKPTVLQLGPRSVDLNDAVVSLPDGKTLALTATELALLRKLAENRGHIVTYDAICDAVWGADYYGYENSLGVHIRHLREKLETEPGAPRFLRTVRGIGYKLTKEGEP